jgi:glycosyltransferase involved in cell wall biosynthesis
MGNCFKILHLGKFFPPEYGGIESVTDTLAVGASASGHLVEIVCFTNKQSRVERRGAVVIRRHKSRLVCASQPLSFSYFAEAWRQSRRADIVHIHAPNYLALLACLWLPKSIHLVLHWHSDVVGKGWLQRALAFIERKALTRASVVVSTTDQYAVASPSLRPFLAKTTTIPIGIPDHSPSLGNVELAKEIGRWKDGRLLVLSIGRLVSYKGFDVLIDAAQKTSSKLCCFGIVGAGPLENKLQSHINDQGLGKTVMLLGELCFDDLMQLIYTSDIFCLPSVERSEAFGVVLLEAMRAGLPIVATQINGSGVPFVNAHRESGLNVETGNSHALATALSSLVNDAELRKTYGRNARKRFEATFIEERMTTSFLELYSLLMD